MQEEISLRELIEIILKGKKLIAGITILAVLIAGIASFFVLPEKYEAQAKIVFDKTFIGQQGLSIESYEHLIATHARLEQVFEQMALDRSGYTLNLLKKSVETQLDKEASEIVITVRGTEPEVIKTIANKLAASSVVDFKTRLIDSKSKEIAKARKSLTMIENQLEKSPKLLGATEAGSTNNKTIVVPQVNPLYERLSIRWDETNYLLIELESEIEYLQDSIKTGGKGLYIITQEASVPEEPVSPKSILNVAAATVLGIMVSIFVVFFLEYWRNTESKE